MTEKLLLCPVCGSEDDHEAIRDNWFVCGVCQCHWCEDSRDPDAIPWKCYHCSTVCNTFEEAHQHFGVIETDKPICKVNAEEYRRMEEVVRSYSAEDSQLHRELLAQAVHHRAALVLAEESGYARGLTEGRSEKNAQ